MGGNLDNLKPTDNPRNVATETTNNASFNKEYNSSCQGGKRRQYKNQPNLIENDTLKQVCSS